MAFVYTSFQCRIYAAPVPTGRRVDAAYMRRRTYRSSSGCCIYAALGAKGLIQYWKDFLFRDC